LINCSNRESSHQVTGQATMQIDDRDSIISFAFVSVNPQWKTQTATHNHALEKVNEDDHRTKMLRQ